MQELTPIKKPPAGTCPSDEDLAAYIDGNLEGAEKERITEHLASCEDCFEIYAGAVRFQLDSGSEAEEKAAAAAVVPFPSKERGWNPWWYRIAALLVVGIGIGAAYNALLAPPPALVTAEVAAPIPGRVAFPTPDRPESFWLGPTYRGGEEQGEGVPLDSASFQMGVQLVNLQVSLQAGNAEQAQDVVAHILRLVKPQLLADDLYKRYAALTAALVGQRKQDLLPEASRLARESREVFDAESLDLGQWVEAGRLAALARDPSFFQQGTTRSFLRRLLWRDKVGLGETQLDPLTRESLQEISRILSEGDLQDADYGNLVQEFEEILQIHYPKA